MCTGRPPIEWPNMNVRGVSRNLYLPPSSWTYSMQRTMQEIIPGVFLGPHNSAQRKSRASLIENGITHIICVRQPDLEEEFIRPQFSDGDFSYLTLNIADSDTENIIRFFPKVRHFIDGALAKNGKVLIHGNKGVSRSAALTQAYIMESYNLSCSEAFKILKERRGCIDLKEGFVQQLAEYEPIYQAREVAKRGGTSAETTRCKRKSEHLSESIDIDLIPPPPSPVSSILDDFSKDFCDELCVELWLLKGT